MDNQYKEMQMKMAQIRNQHQANMQSTGGSALHTAGSK